MAKRGEKGAKTSAPTEHDRQDIRRLLRKAGSREVLSKWIAQEPVLEDFDNAILPMLAVEEENFWKHMRTPEGRKFKAMTRKENILLILDAIWDRRKELGLGQSKDAVVKRLIRKLSKGGDKPRS